MICMTEVSASVVVSPISRPSATSRSSRRMILPERVFGSSLTMKTWRGRAIAPICCGDVRAQHVARRLVVGAPARPGWPCRITNATTAWPVVSSDAPTTAASAVHGCATSDGLDLGGREPVARHVHDVVDAAEQPDVAVFVAAGAVAGEVLVAELLPVGLLEALGVAPDAAEHRRPRLGDHEQAAALALDARAVVVDDVDRDAGDRHLRRCRA